RRCRSTGRWDPKRQRTAGAGVSRAGIIGRRSPGSRRDELAAAGGVDRPEMKEHGGPNRVKRMAPGVPKTERGLAVTGTPHWTPLTIHIFSSGGWGCRSFPLPSAGDVKAERLAPIPCGFSATEAER